MFGGLFIFTIFVCVANSFRLNLGYQTRPKFNYLKIKFTDISCFQNKAILSHSDVSLDILQKIMSNHYKKLREQKLMAKPKDTGPAEAMDLSSGLKVNSYGTANPTLEPQLSQKLVTRYSKESPHTPVPRADPVEDKEMQD